MRAALDDFAIVCHQDHVRIPNRAQPVGDHKAGAWRVIRPAAGAGFVLALERLLLISFPRLCG